MTRATTGLPAPDVRDREFWTSERVRPALATAVARADDALGTPWPEARASQFARFWRDGDRKEYESGAVGRQHRLTYATLAALHTGSERFLDETIDGVILLCEQSTWCWAAHDHTHARRGHVVPDVTDPCLDLGAGEVAAQLAWVDHLLGPVIDDRAPGVRARVRHEVDQRVLRPFTERRDWWWLGVNHPIMNWSPWIQGNVLAAALALEDDDARRRHIVDLVAQGIAAYWDSLPADGGVDEGYHYWWQGAARALEAQDLLDRARGREPGRQPSSADDPFSPGAHGTEVATRPAPPSDGDADRAGIIRQVVAFPHRMHLGGDWYVSIADSPARPIWTWPWNVAYAWARRVGDADAARHAASYRRFDEILWDERVTLSRAVGILADDAWAALPSDATAPLVGEVFLPETQVALARTRAGTPRGLAVVVKGGHNGENHNHNDVGQVSIALDGVPVVVDAGKPTYRAGTFDERRYTHWPMRSAWHNVPLIRGVEQSGGAEFAARHFAVTTTAAGDVWRAELDLAGAYDPGIGVDRWWRRVTLDRGRESVTVVDRWSIHDVGTDDHSRAREPDFEVTSWTWLLVGDVEIDESAGHAIVVHDDGQREREVRPLRVTWDPWLARATLDPRAIDDDELASVWGPRLTRLSLSLREESSVGEFTTTFHSA